ncbi:TonB-dependent receptor [Aquimarina sp. ERC-38]|uniref:TonB-dependent receptor n=1 Tax=Aquimarina sp. ERC-38 TaxID=2949996 RepID=UPI002B250A3D|nr:TonB-dependent receptor [Aquimarina sp. ERC-38]
MQIDSLGSYVIKVSGLSYADVFIPLKLENHNKPIEKNIVLKNDSFTLDQVIINANAAITVKKDTIIFKANRFADGSEEIAEDILKKLPGVEVDNDGQIKVQGKAVEKVMIEGDDLFEKGYSLLTKNLNSNSIDKVEILQRFSDNPLLKGIENSDKVAINLTLKQGQKTSLFGNASLGYGTDNFYENRLNLISFNKDTKFYVFSNVNNTGIDAIGDIYKIINPNVFSDITYVGDDIGAIDIINIEGLQPDLKKERINLNNSEFASLNTVYNPLEKLKIKGIAFFNTDEISFFNTNTIQYLIGEDSFTNNEEGRIRKKLFTGFGKLDGIYSINDDSRIEYVSKYNIGKQNSREALTFNDESINKQLDTDNVFIDQRITYTKRQKDKSALLITGRYTYDEKPQNFSVDQFLFENLFPEEEEIESILQNVDYKFNYLALEGNYITKINKNNLDIKLGYQNTNSKLKSSLSFKNNNQTSFPDDNLFSNNLNYLFSDLYLKSKYSWEIGKVVIRPSFQIHQLFVTVNQNSSDNSESIFYVVPGIGLNYSINKKNKLSFAYEYETKNFSFSDVQSGYILTNFRNFNRGLGNFEQLNNSFFFANYVYGNWSDEFLINSTFLYLKNDQYKSSRSEIVPNYSLSETFILDDKEQYTWNTSIDKFVEQLSINFKVKGGISETNFQNIVNNSELRDIRSRSFNYGVEIRSIYNGVFNFHIGSKSITSEVSVNSNVSNINNTSFLDLNFEVSEKLHFKLSNERYFFGNSNRDNTYYFTDFDAKYVIKKNALTLKFLARNIWNTDTFATYYVGDTNQLISENKILPQYFLLKLDFKF